MTAPDDLVEKLREQSLGYQRTAWNRLDGGQDFSLAAASLDLAAEEIERLRAEREHWLQFVSTADRVQFPFNPEQ